VSGGMVGADIEALRLLADKFDEGSEKLDNVVTAIEAAMPQLDAWNGADGESFREEWNGNHLARLRDTAVALTDVAVTVRSNADAQQTTSDDYAGGAVGGGVGVGAGAGNGSGGGGGGSDSGGENGGGPTFSGNGPEGQFERNNSEYTSERHGTYDEAGNFTPSGTDADGNPIDAANGAGDPTASVTLAEGEVEGFVGAEAGVEGEFGSEDGAHGSGEAGVQAGLGANASGSVGLNENGLTAEGAVGVSAGATASASGQVGYGEHLSAEGEAEAFVGACAGAEASASASGTVAGVTAGAEGEVYAGIGVKASADVDVGWDNVGVDFELGAALGIGAGFSVSFDVSPADTVDAIADAGGAVLDAGGDALDGIGDFTGLW
jgi:uncharacterized protein YukE